MGRIEIDNRWEMAMISALGVEVGEPVAAIMKSNFGLESFEDVASDENGFEGVVREFQDAYAEAGVPMRLIHFPVTSYTELIYYLSRFGDTGLIDIFVGVGEEEGGELPDIFHVGGLRLPQNSFRGHSEIGVIDGSTGREISPDLRKVMIDLRRNGDKLEVFFAERVGETETWD